VEEKRRYRQTVNRASGDQPRTQYRLYFMNGPNRRITYSHEFEAESEERALRIAEGWREGRGAELWEGNRKLRSWDSDD